MCPVLQSIQKGFMLVCGTEAATEVKDSVIISQGQTLQEFCQIIEAVTYFRRVIFVGFLIDLVQLVQDGFAVAVAGIKGVCFDVSF